MARVNAAAVTTPTGRPCRHTTAVDSPVAWVLGGWRIGHVCSSRTCAPVAEFSVGAMLADGVAVGRERQMARLREAVESARQGGAGAGLITGEAGIGKTYLT